MTEHNTDIRDTYHPTFIHVKGAHLLGVPGGGFVQVLEHSTDIRYANNAILIHIEVAEVPVAVFVVVTLPGIRDRRAVV